MDAETFIEYLKKPSKLYQVSYQQLKSLVLQYPYCQNLRFLLVKKSQLDSHKDMERNKQLAASYSIDRGYLFKLLREEKRETEEADSYLIGEEYLELKELTGSSGFEKDNRLEEDDLLFDPEENELILDEISPLLKETDQFADHQQDREGPDVPEKGHDAGALNLYPEIEELFDISEGEETGPSEDPGFMDTSNLSDMENNMDKSGSDVGQAPESRDALDQNIIPDIIAGLKAADYLRIKIKGLGNPGKYPDPAPKSSFSSWLRQFQPPRPSEHFQYRESRSPKDPGALPVKEKAPEYFEEPDEEQGEELETYAQQSIIEHEELATETLAFLLEKQKQYGKAIDMYKRLSLIFPEKSTFFAEKIEQLEKFL